MNYCPSTHNQLFQWYCHSWKSSVGMAMIPGVTFCSISSTDAKQWPMSPILSLRKCQMFCRVRSVDYSGRRILAICFFTKTVTLWGWHKVQGLGTRYNCISTFPLSKCSEATHATWQLTYKLFNHRTLTHYLDIMLTLATFSLFLDTAVLPSSPSVSVCLTILK